MAEANFDSVHPVIHWEWVYAVRVTEADGTKRVFPRESVDIILRQEPKYTGDTGRSIGGPVSRPVATDDGFPLGGSIRKDGKYPWGRPVATDADGKQQNILRELGIEMTSRPDLWVHFCERINMRAVGTGHGEECGFCGKTERELMGDDTTPPTTLSEERVREIVNEEINEAFGLINSVLDAAQGEKNE